MREKMRKEGEKKTPAMREETRLNEDMKLQVNKKCKLRE
jgi:hypothetical protein